MVQMGFGASLNPLLCVVHSGGDSVAEMVVL